MAKPPEREIIPVVQKLRLRYTKRGPLKFSSHRDFQRAFERAVRKVGVPMAYSAGFSPHPKISYANAAPTGTASEAEYVEISLVNRVNPDELVAALATAMPEGLAIAEAVEVRTSDFSERLEAGLWRVEVAGWDLSAAEGACAGFLAAQEVAVTRQTKNGPRTFDCRSAVLDLEVEGVNTGSSGVNYAILRLLVRQMTPSVRPDDVLNGICQVAALTLPAAPRVTRLAQGPLTADGRSVADPLTADRAGAQEG